MRQTANAPKTTDARKLRSREALYAAFLTLLEHKNLDQISIREIAAEANLGHATFYRHYLSKEALLNDLAADEIRRLVNLSLPVMNSESTRAACEALCIHVFGNRNLWTTLLTGGAATAVKDELLLISRKIAADIDSTSQDSELAALKIILSVNSITDTLAWWLRQEKPLPPGRVAGILEQVIALPDHLSTE